MGDISREEGYLALADKEPLHQWEITLQPKEDYQPHSMEYLLPQLEKGHYIILMSADKDFKKIKNNALFDQSLWVTDLTANIRNRSGETDVIVLDKMSGQSIPNVKVDVLEEKYDYKTRKYITRTVASGKTNEMGMFQFSKNEYSGSYYYKFEHHEDYYYHDSRQYSYWYRDYDERKEVTYFFTDRAIYRPGQTVHFKGISLKI